MERQDYERLRWRCIRRALLELDITLTRFLDDGFDQLSEEEQAAFVDLVAMEDHDLWYLISGKEECREDEAHFVPVVEKLRKCSVRLAG
ncbi:MAG: succinate dehydrogenase assembly factor 2 [Azonexus sp.]|jgi:succinate dehydrogenase flavin-adding protein (antitoxin of CptAB toxin-antitoxin module)|nr:succinate dehydrogenase assembly factor 2 [Azonexus sp.]